MGPTHDDITADSVAKAFGVGIDHHPEVVARFRERFQGAGELNEARLRMARIPDGAELIQSATILAPGFKIGNVIVMAGGPAPIHAVVGICGPRRESGGGEKNWFVWKMVDGRLPPPPSAKTLGIEFVQIDGERGTIEVKFEAKPEFLNPAGNVQGGFLAAMLDDTMGPALTATLEAGEFAPTVNLNVQFHRPAKAGSLKGAGRVVRRGEEVCQLSSALFQNDRIVATATATSAIQKM